MPTSDICRRMSVRLPGWKKISEPSDATGLVMAASNPSAPSAARLAACAGIDSRVQAGARQVVPTLSRKLATASSRGSFIAIVLTRAGGRVN